MRKKMYWGLGVFIILLISVGVFQFAQSEITVDAHIAAAEKLIIDEAYYEALLALEPLLTSNVKGETQEKALWIAHQLGEKATEMFLQECDAIWDEVMKRTDNSILAGEARSQLYSEKVNFLNQLGADIWYDEMDGTSYYGMGFLRQLIDKYPDTPKRPFAEYHGFYNGGGFPKIEESIEGINELLKNRNAYVEKYEKTGRIEVYMVYQRIAHINHWVWAVLTFPDHPEVDFNFVSSDNPEMDKQLAAKYKAEALKYYALYQINPYGLRDETERFQRLKNNEAFGFPPCPIGLLGC